MARRSDHSREELQEIILKVATAIIEKEGISGLTARRIASDIGYAPGTIYNIFSSMDDICLHLNARTLDNLYNVLSSPTCNNPKKTSIQNMKAMAKAYLDFAEKNRAHWLMLFTHSLPEGETIPDWYQDKINMLFSPLEELLTPYFTPTQAEKRTIAARTLWASVHGICYLEKTRKITIVDKKTPATNMTDYLIDSFIGGISN